ncbi:hypothetical protein AGDE_04454 [Angomonas deanei]|nr:hypothetical protein AGDE_04454 [Angomonas deanei]|eukprot:EPY39474.1 hypothetical protein AGDE_04454 [Angomonas deanei]
MFLSLAFWALYPGYIRFRHKYIFRYRNTQLVYRRGWLATEHIPKWNKKYLERLVVPLETTANKAGESVSVVPVDSQEIAVRPDEAGDVTLHIYGGGKPFQKKELSLRASPKTPFTNGDGLHSFKKLSEAVQRVNTVFYQTTTFTAVQREDTLASVEEVRAYLSRCIKESYLAVVLVESRTDSKAIPEGFEVWWLSSDEFKRRQFCVLWLLILGFARCLQDMLDMPEMPDFAQ